MPLVTKSSYNPDSLILRSGHLATIVPALFSQVDYSKLERDHVTLSDGEYLAFDWLRAPSPTNKLLIVIPGIEGESRRNYMMRTAEAAVSIGWDVVLLNLRGCGGVSVNVAKTYHGGVIDDLHEFLSEIIAKQPRYEIIDLGGFSLGGNIILNYLGNPRHEKADVIRKAFAFSVPCDFLSSSHKMKFGANHFLYGRRFVKSLKEKVGAHRSLFSDSVDWEAVDKTRSLWDFDNHFTAKANGFENVRDYYSQVGSLQFLAGIKKQSLLVNSLNDPMLSPECFPFEIAENSEFFHFESPKHGGHVGYGNQLRLKSFYYTERILAWMDDK